MQPQTLAPNAPDYTVSRHFEAYLLWLVGLVLFYRFHNDSVNKHLIWYAQELTNASLEEIQKYTWGQ